MSEKTVRKTMPEGGPMPAIGNGTLDYSLAHIIELLQQYQASAERMTLRERTTLVAEVQEAVRQLGISIGVRAGFSPTSGKERVRSYLLAAPNEVIEGKE